MPEGAPPPGQSSPLSLPQPFWSSCWAPGGEGGLDPRSGRSEWGIPAAASIFSSVNWGQWVLVIRDPPGVLGQARQSPGGGTLSCSLGRRRGRGSGGVVCSSA